VFSLPENTHIEYLIMNNQHSQGTTEKNEGLGLAFKFVALICLLAGLALGAAALAGPLAVWFGLADFRLGFSILRKVNAWSSWIALTTFCIALLIFAIAKTKSIGNGRTAAWALVGSIVAAASWYIPETFRPPEGTPGIHDIATNPDAPLEYIAIAPLRDEASNNMEYGEMPNMTPAQHKALQINAYPDIVPQEFQNASVEQVYQRALAAANTMGWEVVDSRLENGIGRIEATDTTFWFRFKDDVVVEITEQGNGAVLNARSLSRVGRGDVGKNAARLREFFAKL